MDFKLSKRSLSRLEGVNSRLVSVVKRAIQITPIDFGVTEGVRTMAKQRRLVASRASHTLKSKHLTGDAVDLVAYIGREIRWDAGLYFQIANAMRQAAIDVDVPEVTWGAVWIAPLTAYETAEVGHDVYVDYKRRQGKRPFFDGPHFQLGTS